MKRIILISTLIIIVLFCGCSSENLQDKSSNSQTSANNASGGLKVLKWGPEEPIKIGTIPNKQPDGKMGLWISTSSAEGIGEAQVLLDGKPQLTASSNKGFSAGISPEDISKVGERKVEIKITSTGQIIPVGTLKIVQ